MMILVILLHATAILAGSAIPSQAVTITISNNRKRTGTIVRSSSIPTDSKMFEDENEVLYSIKTTEFIYFGARYLCSMGLIALDQNHEKKNYLTGWLCNEEWWPDEILKKEVEF